MTGPRTPAPATPAREVPAPEVPAAALLPHLIGAVAEWLPRHCRTLLAADRFADGRAALRRVADPAGAAAATGWLDPAEARRLAELVLARWSALGPAEVPALAVILPPARDGDHYRLAVHGAAADWTATWSGPVHAAADGRSARPDPAGAVTQVTARVFAHTAAGRTVLPARVVPPVPTPSPAPDGEPVDDGPPGAARSVRPP